jgi:hypothetical protein
VNSWLRLLISCFIVIGKVKVEVERDKTTIKYLKSSTQTTAACLAVHSRVAKSERERELRRSSARKQARKGTCQRVRKRTVTVINSTLHRVAYVRSRGDNRARCVTR